jgi:hypothetical protein
MRKLRVPILLSLLCACEHGPPEVVANLPQPTPPSTSLSPAARAQLRGTIDLDAMDRLLTTLGPGDRAQFLSSFQDAEWAAAGRSDVETRDVSVTVWYAEPERQRLLEHVWAPFWSQLPSALLSDPSYPLPGRALAAARLADSAAVARKRRDP